MDKLNRREANVLGKNLSPGEKVLGQYVGKWGQALVLTDRKALIIKAGPMAGVTFGAKAASFDYGTITAVEVQTGMLRGLFEIAGGGIQGGSGWSRSANAPNCIQFDRRDSAKFQEAAAIIRDRSSASNPQPSSPAILPDRYEQLARIATLREKGVLTDTEFEAEKARILGNAAGLVAEGSAE